MNIRTSTEIGHLKGVIYLALGMLFVPSCFANCYDDAHLQNLAQVIAERHFGAPLTGNLPRVLVCDDAVLGGLARADYTSGYHRIRFTRSTAYAPDVMEVMAHELAHAVVAINGYDPDPSRGGHGRNFVQVLRNAGFHDEANRVAQQYGVGSNFALGAPSAAPMRPDGFHRPARRANLPMQCYIRERRFPLHDRHGNVVRYCIERVQVCE
jgi:hypothetical protein